MGRGRRREERRETEEKGGIKDTILNAGGCVVDRADVVGQGRQSRCSSG